MSSKIELSQDDFQDSFCCSAPLPKDIFNGANNMNESFNYTSVFHLQSKIIDRFVIKYAFEWCACLINNDFLSLRTGSESKQRYVAAERKLLSSLSVLSLIL